MAKVIQHLATAPSTGYTIFEDNQVLTKEPLNRLVDYLDDQERLTRVSLLGVGIFCGLRLTIGTSGVTLSKGVAVTTDGDLLRAAGDLTYTRFRTYGPTAPKYDPFYDGEKMRPVFQLIGEEEDAAAAKLTDFGTQTGQKLTDLIGVLLMESFQKDTDLCTGGDCDNKGKDALANVRLLLMAPADVAALRESLATFTKVSAQIPLTYTNRVVLNAGIDTPAKLAAAYKTASAATRVRLLVSLKQILRVCGPFFGDVFASDPLAGWTAKLNAPLPDGAAQQYFDHLKDVVEACNALGAVLAGDSAVCCPPQTAFPKHVLLGAAGTAPLDVDANRTGCYPSPLVASRQAFDRARFMLRRIDALIMGFAEIPPALPVTITPSRTDDRPLDERAIPAHYGVAPAASWPIHRAWSYELERRGLGEFNYSANKAVFTPKGAAGEPLVASIAAASFLRIEGHIGSGVQAAMNTINAAITASNLPFAVRAVLLHTERAKVIVKPGMRYNDLYRLHDLYRHDLARQIDDIKAQTEDYHTDVTVAVGNGAFSNNALGTNVSITDTAKQAMDKVTVSANVAVSGLDKKYTEYRAMSSWKQNADVAVEQSANMWMTLGDITKTEVGLSVGPLYSTYKPLWPEWLDKIIDAKNDDEDDKLLFKNFIARHPSAEHLCGVARGGTFVLIYIDGGTVVGDVTLPYYWPEDAEPEPPARELPKPIPRPIPKKPWIVRQPWDAKWKVDLDRFKVTEFEPFKQFTTDFPDMYFNALSKSTEILTKFQAKDKVPPARPSYADKQLEALVDSMLGKSQSLAMQRKLLLDPALDAAKQREITNGIQRQEAELIETIGEVGRVATGPNVNAATDGANAVSLMAEVTSTLSSKSAGTVAVRLKETMGATTVKPEMRNMMGGMLKGLQL